jgi:hypothetical protein
VLVIFKCETAALNFARNVEHFCELLYALELVALTGVCDDEKYKFFFLLREAKAKVQSQRVSRSSLG